MKTAASSEVKVRYTKSTKKKIFPITTLINTEMYWVYAPIADDAIITVSTTNITSENWSKHYDAILNIMKDGIDTDQVQMAKIEILFADGNTINLTLMDYMLNLIMWYMLIRTGTPIMSYHLFFSNDITKDTIKDYIDRFFIDENRKKYSNKELNNIIDDTIYHFHDIDQFAFFLSNTVNLEDNVFLMNKNEEFNQCMHVDISNVPLEDVKSVGMSYAMKAIDCMKNAKKELGYDHCLADAWRASEGINPKQFKEFTINIGTKPDGRGGVFPNPIATSYINGGVTDPLSYFIESSTGRIAQIIKFNNVGSSGSFARLLGLNNMDSYLNKDPHYDCGSLNFVRITVNDKKTLSMINNRYYRLNPRGLEYCIKAKTDTHLIGKTIYLRSPMTCASAARGEGVCYKCYGDLAYTLYDPVISFGINIGRIASETLSSRLTQMLLSAKHMLESAIERLNWVSKFNELFIIDGNVVMLDPDTDPKRYRLYISPDEIELENEEDDDLSGSIQVQDSDETVNIELYNEYITQFDVMDNMTGEMYHINNDKMGKLYITNELNSIIRKKGEPIEGFISIDFSELKTASLFVIPIENNELSKTLDRLKSLINKKPSIAGMSKDNLNQALYQAVIDGGLKISGVHLELILSNQIRDADNVLLPAQWFKIDPAYQILTLNEALTNNPSVTISLSYQKIGKMLYNPLTYKKHGASFMDLFFMSKPQYAIRGIEPPQEEEFKPVPGELFDPLVIIGNPNKVTVPERPDDVPTIIED